MLVFREVAQIVVVASMVVLLSWGTRRWIAPLVGGSTNYGVSFGVAHSVPAPVLFGGLLIVFFGVVWWQRKYFTQFPLASGLFCGGATANLLERLFSNGGVHDWIFLPGLNLYNNLADWAIFIGWSLFLYYTLAHKKDAVFTPSKS